MRKVSDMAEQGPDKAISDVEPVALAEPTIAESSPEPLAEQQPLTPQKPRRGGFFGGLIGGIVAAGLGYGLAQYVPKGWPLQDTSTLQANLDAQAAEITALKQQLAALPPAQDLSGLTAEIAALQSKLAELEARPTTALDQSAALKDLQAQIEALKSAPPDPAAAQAFLQEAEAAAAKIRADAEATAASANAKLALASVRSALENGAPFAESLTQLGEAPAALSDLAGTGVPTQQQLIESFPAAARTAIDAALRENMGSSWTDRATNFLRTQTGARSTDPHAGTDADAILSRAEAALNAGDLKACLVEMDSLPAIAQTEMAAWRAQADKRQAALEAVAGLEAQMNK
jgi:hypothetical protein